MCRIQKNLLDTEISQFLWNKELKQKAPRHHLGSEHPGSEGKHRLLVNSTPDSTCILSLKATPRLICFGGSGL